MCLGTPLQTVGIFTGISNSGATYFPGKNPVLCNQLEIPMLWMSWHCRHLARGQTLPSVQGKYGGKVWRVGELYRAVDPRQDATAHLGPEVGTLPLLQETSGCEKSGLIQSNPCPEVLMQADTLGELFSSSNFLI